ncbi:hypothetical protein WKK05_40980 (plasmid) [Nostoc sp. UHCC 0302]|uniref:hypothetical protein n=1 Tax=Nostoc sp. UHCC 0302 TaxID=3134896 RepID=UPI00311C9CA7
MASDALTPFFTHADAIAQRIRESNEYRLEQEIKSVKSTINIQIEKASDVKAVEKLRKSQAGIKVRQQRFEQVKGFLFWVGGWLGSGRSAIFAYLITSSAVALGSVMLGINTPSTIPCPDKKSYCYQLRINKNEVILPEQAKQLLIEYERSKQKKPRHRRK